MSLGLPAHFARQLVRRSFIHAQHVVAQTLLSVAVLTVLVFQSARLESMVWLACLGLAPLIVLLWAPRNSRGVVWSTGYLILGTLGLYEFAFVVLSQPIPVVQSDGFSFLAVKVALIMVGGVGLSVRSGLFWTASGYLLAELAVGLAQFQLGHSLRFDLASFAAFVATASILPLVGLVNRAQLLAQPRLQRAAHEERLAGLRYGIEVKAAALMHDTVLNHLAAVAEFRDGAPTTELFRQMGRDAEVLIGERWLAEVAIAVNPGVRLDWQHSGLFVAIQEGRLLGLDIEVTGELIAVTRMDRECSTALGHAVKQCLVNVLKHSGTRHAEVAVYSSESELSVMVVDAGKGFTEAATGTDRLGLRTSVRRRIEAVGGVVNVWSRPGRGTSIMIRLPVAVEAGTPRDARQILAKRGIGWRRNREAS